MKKFLALACAAAMTLTLVSCGSGSDTIAQTGADDGDIVIAATTYPIYLFTTAVTEGVDGVTVEQIVTDKVSCIHDYTLTVPQMKIIEGADVVVENGVGFEAFMADALSASSADVIDCSENIDLLTLTEDGQPEDDPHIWMSPANAETMIGNIASGLAALDIANSDAYLANADKATAAIQDGIVPDGDYLSAPQVCRLITFHDGFQYFSQYFGLTLEAAIEEESGSEASAKDIDNIIGLIGQYNIPAVFTEVNGSDSTAQAIARETGVGVYPLDLIMSGDGTGVEPYIEAINRNYYTIRDAFSTAAE